MTKSKRVLEITVLEKRFWAEYGFLFAQAVIVKLLPNIICYLVYNIFPVRKSSAVVRRWWNRYSIPSSNGFNFSQSFRVFVIITDNKNRRKWAWVIRIKIVFSSCSFNISLLVFLQGTAWRRQWGWKILKIQQVWNHIFKNKTILEILIRFENICFDKP